MAAKMIVSRAYTHGTLKNTLFLVYLEVSALNLTESGLILFNLF